MLKLLFFPVVLFAGISCCINEPGRASYMELTSDSTQSQQFRIEKFQEFPIERQIDTFLFAKKCVEGGDFVMGYITYHGEKKIMSIASRLDRSESNTDKSILISSLAEIERSCKCVSTNVEVMDILARNESSSDVAKDSYAEKSSKELYIMYLKAIRENSNK